MILTLIPLLLLAVFITFVVLFGALTADQVGYVLGLFVHHAVPLGTFIGAILNLVTGGFALPFDIIVYVLRSVGVI